MYTPEKKSELTAVKPAAPVAAPAAAEKPAKAVRAPKAAKPAKEKAPKAAKPAKEKAPKAEKPAKTVKAPKAEKVVKSTAKVTLVVEHQGRQFTPDAMTAAAHRLWTNGGRSVSEIETLDLYVKAEDAAVYCVVNGISIGKFEL